MNVDGAYVDVSVYQCACAMWCGSAHGCVDVCFYVCATRVCESVLGCERRRGLCGGDRGLGVQNTRWSATRACVYVRVRVGACMCARASIPDR